MPSLPGVRRMSDRTTPRIPVTLAKLLAGLIIAFTLGLVVLAFLLLLGLV